MTSVKITTTIQVPCIFLASTVKVCSRNDPNVAKCIIESLKDLQPRLASGVLAPDFKIPVITIFRTFRNDIEL